MSHWRIVWVRISVCRKALPPSSRSASKANKNFSLKVTYPTLSFTKQITITDCLFQIKRQVIAHFSNEMINTSFIWSLKSITITNHIITAWRAAWNRCANYANNFKWNNWPCRWLARAWTSSAGTWSPISSTRYSKALIFKFKFANMKSLNANRLRTKLISEYPKTTPKKLLHKLKFI